MVFYFTTEDGTTIYMGKDKHENEILIANGWPEDVWFHVDDISSAHVYLRLPLGSTWDDISDSALEDCCQLVKANSIKGCKMTRVKIVYTPWANLKKRPDMEAGQVSFKSSKSLRYFTVEKKNKDILKRLAKTKREVWPTPDLRAEKVRRDEKVRQQEKQLRNEQAAAKKQAEEDYRREREARSYDNLFSNLDTAEACSTHVEASKDQSAAVNFEEDFM